MVHLPSLIETTLGIPPDVQFKLLKSILLVLVVWFCRRMLLLVSLRHSQDTRVIYLWGKTTYYLSILLLVLLIGPIWVQGVGILSTFIGLLSAALAIVLKDPLLNLSGWGFILWQKPYTVGDRIRIGAETGDVLDIGLFNTTVMELGNWVGAEQSTGVITMIPNGKVFTEVIQNYNSRGFQPIWNEIPVLITFNSNWQKAKTMLLAIAERHALAMDEEVANSLKYAAKSLMITASRFTPRVYTSVGESGVLLSVRYLCDPRNRRDTVEAIWEEVLHVVETEPDITLAYPTRFVYSEPVNPQPQ